MTSSEDADAAAKKAAAAERKRKRLEAWRKRQKEKQEEAVPPKKKVTMSLGLSLKRKKVDVSSNNNNKPKKKKKKRTIEFSDFNDEEKPEKSLKTNQEMEEELNTTTTTSTNSSTTTKEKSLTTDNGSSSSTSNNRKKRNRWDATPKTLETAEKKQEVVVGGDDALDSFMEKLEAGAMGSVAMQNKLEVLKVDVGGSMMNLSSKKTPMASPLTGGVITAEDLARLNQSSKQKDGAIFTASDWESDNVNNEVESSSEVCL